MVTKISHMMSAGERQQLQRFLDRYGVAKQNSQSKNADFQLVASKANGITASDLQQLLQARKAGGSIPKNLEGTAYAKYLESVFNPQGRTLMEKDGKKVSVTHDEWEESVQLRLSDLAERLMKLRETGSGSILEQKSEETDGEA